MDKNTACMVAATLAAALLGHENRKPTQKGNAATPTRAVELYAECVAAMQKESIFPKG